MFCKVVKSVYICISKQGKCNLSVHAMNFGVLARHSATWQWGSQGKNSTKICKVEKYTYFC